MKKCFKCGEVKDMSAFYRHSQMKDGHLNKCKDCTKSDNRKHRSDNLEKVREYDRARGSLPHRVAARKEYSKTDGFRRSSIKSNRRYRRENPKKYCAHKKVNRAIKTGALVNPRICSECGSGGNIHGHHDDYDKVLDVRWLCHSCHIKWHKENGEGKNP